ncbi:MAG: DMT family transporter [Alphaproteobacteria bacterium]
MTSINPSVNPIAKNLIIYGVLWILFNNFILCIQSATIKTLAASLHTFQIIFIYKFVVFLCVIPWILYKGIGKIKTKKIHMHIIRAALSLTGGMLFTQGLKQLNLAESMAIAFTEPLFLSVLAILLLKEKYNKITLISILTGFVGALIVIRPGTTAFSSGALWVLSASIVWAFDNLVIKQLGKTESSIQYVFYVSFFSTLFAAPFAFVKWQTIPDAIEFTKAGILQGHSFNISFILFTLALYYFAHLLAVFRAFRYANLSTLAPFDFSRLVISSLIGYSIFNDKIDQWVVVGSIIIIASTAQIIWNKEHQK